MQLLNAMNKCDCVMQSCNELQNAITKRIYGSMFLRAHCATEIQIVQVASMLSGHLQMLSLSPRILVDTQHMLNSFADTHARLHVLCACKDQT